LQQIHLLNPSKLLCSELLVTILWTSDCFRVLWQIVCGGDSFDYDKLFFCSTECLQEYKQTIHSFSYPTLSVQRACLLSFLLV